MDIQDVIWLLWQDEFCENRDIDTNNNVYEEEIAYDNVPITN